jgi:SAM-dependent methyltransferase
MSTTATRVQWPKTVPPLTPAQLAAREAWYIIWLERYNKNGIMEYFNQGFPASLPVPKVCRTLQIGPGRGDTLSASDMASDTYHVLELRDEFCKKLAERMPVERIHQGSIEERQNFPDGSFDRVLAVHVLEHLPNLPAALAETERLLTPDGVLDVILPCEGEPAYTVLRYFTTKRWFESRFKMAYEPIIRSEHVNRLWEVKQALNDRFTAEITRHFPLRAPIDAVNVFVGYRFRKKR